MGQSKTAKVTIESGWMLQSAAARALGVTRQTVLVRAAKGRYRTKRIAGMVVVREEDVMKDVADNQPRRKAVG
jgi:hypothetical protein